MGVRPDLLIGHYRSLGLFGDTGATYAPERCRFASACWAGEGADRFPTKARGQAYRPWIGPNYDTVRLVIIGENFYDHGGFDAAEQIVQCAAQLLKQGVSRMNFGDTTYKGTLLFHRAALYAGAWLTAIDIKDVALERVFDFVAFTNHVKCSPQSSIDEQTRKRTRSTPNSDMWRNCCLHVLAGELRLLDARRVLVIGNSCNGGAFRSNAWPGLDLIRQQEKVALYRTADGRELVVVPHPASPGGAALSILDDMKLLLNSATA